MSNNTIHILVSFDGNYIAPFRTMLTSLLINNPAEHFHIWLLHSAVSSDDLNALSAYCEALETEFTAVHVSRDCFQNAPVSKQYPQEMYYRLLAPLLLPDSLSRILYLDPDLLIINPLSPLWELDLNGCTFAAASHNNARSELADDFNRFRLNMEHDYFNTGVILMDLDKGREVVKAEKIFSCAQEHSAELLLPDQDVFNILFGKYTAPLDEKIWNYDARYYHDYLRKSKGVCVMDWVMRHTVILHFCGKKKPWQKSYMHRFGVLYKHYGNLAERRLPA